LDRSAFVVCDVLGSEHDVPTDAEKNCRTARDVSDWTSHW